MVYLESEDRQSVYSPCRTLRVDGSVWQNLYVIVFHSEVAVNLFNKVCPVLVAAVDASFKLQSLQRVDMWVADNVFQMPLNGVYPTLQIQSVLNRIPVVWVADNRVNIVFHVIVVDSHVEHFIT